MQIKKCRRGFNCGSEVFLLIEERVGGLTNQGKPRRNAEPQHVVAQFIGMGAGIVEFSRNEREGRIGGINMVARRSEGVDRGSRGLGVAEKGAVVSIIGQQRTVPDA